MAYSDVWSLRDIYKQEAGNTWPVVIVHPSLVNFSTSRFTISGNGTASSPYDGNSTNQNSHSSECNIYFRLEAAPATVDILAITDSERRYDFGEVYINGSRVFRDSGSEKRYNVRRNLNPGDTIRFRYTKDRSVNSNRDRLDYTIYVV